MTVDGCPGARLESTAPAETILGIEAASRRVDYLLPVPGQSGQRLISPSPPRATAISREHSPRSWWSCPTRLRSPSGGLPIMPQPAENKDAMMKTPPFPYQLSRHGWISVAYNQNIWIPCPPVFPEGLDCRSWANLYAEEWWSRTISPPGKHKIKALARTLADMHAFAYSHLHMHLGFLHLPSLNLAPQLVSFGIWEAVGDRAEQLRFLTRADDPAFMQPPRSRNSALATSGPG